MATYTKQDLTLALRQIRGLTNIYELDVAFKGIESTYLIDITNSTFEQEIKATASKHIRSALEQLEEDLQAQVRQAKEDTHSRIMWELSHTL